MESYLTLSSQWLQLRWDEMKAETSPLLGNSVFTTEKYILN